MKSAHVFSAVGLALIAAAASAQTAPSGENTDWSYLQSRSASVAQKRLGTAAAPTEVGRVIDITSTTRWINVTQDEVVRIRSGGRSFDWRSATWNIVSFELDDNVIVMSARCLCA